MAMLISLIFLFAQLLAQPFRLVGDNFLAVCCLLYIVIIFFGALLLNFSELAGNEIVGRRLPPYLLDKFELADGWLTFMLTSGIVGALLLSVAIVCIKLARETVLFDKVYRDATTGLLNKLRFKEDSADLREQSLEASGRVFYWSMDIQGFKAVNDNISHEVGDLALREYGRIVPAAIAKAASQGITTPRGSPSGMTAQVYRTGGDELAVICVKDESVTFAAFYEQLVSTAEQVAMLEHIATQTDGSDDSAAQVPTFLRIGVARTFELADEAEVAVRSRIYLNVFGSLDARGQIASKSQVDAAGLRNYEIRLPRDEETRGSKDLDSRASAAREGFRASAARASKRGSTSPIAHGFGKEESESAHLREGRLPSDGKVGLKGWFQRRRIQLFPSKPIGHASDSVIFAAARSGPGLPSAVVPGSSGVDDITRGSVHRGSVHHGSVHRGSVQFSTEVTGERGATADHKSENARHSFISSSV